MDNFITLAILLIAALLIAHNSHAESIPATYSTLYGCKNPEQPWRTYGLTSREEACLAWPHDPDKHPEYYPELDHDDCKMLRNSDNNTIAACTTQSFQQYVCPANQGWTLNGDTCTRTDCPSGQIRDSNGVCTKDCSKYQYGSYPGKLFYGCVPHPWGNLNGDNYPQTASNDGCAAAPYEIKAGYKANDGTEMWCGTWHYTGKSSNSDQNIPQTIPPPNNYLCDTGTCPGEVNGLNVCLPCKSSSTKAVITGSTSESSNGGSDTPGGTTNETIKQHIYNPDNQTVTTTITNTTITNNNGNLETTTSTSPEKTQDIASFCEQNPQSVLCKASSATSSLDCSIPPSCNGDAVQCAILEQSWREYCAAQPSQGITSMVEAAALGNDEHSSQHLKSIAQIRTLGDLDQTNLIPSGELGDENISLGHWGDITIPWSRLNPALHAMGNIVVAFSMILAARILFRRA